MFKSRTSGTWYPPQHMPVIMWEWGHEFILKNKWPPWQPCFNRVLLWNCKRKYSIESKPKIKQIQELCVCARACMRVCVCVCVMYGVCVCVCVGVHFIKPGSLLRRTNNQGDISVQMEVLGLRDRRNTSSKIHFKHFETSVQSWSDIHLSYWSKHTLHEQCFMHTSLQLCL